MMRRGIGRRGPGLVRTVARTAVIAGTATAVSNRVTDRHNQKAMAAQQDQMVDQAALDSQAELDQMQQQLNTLEAQQAQAAVSGAPAGGDLTSQLQQLAALKSSGVLTDAEFEAAKAKVLGG